MTPTLAQLWIKICGITRGDDADIAAELGASAVGLVFYPKSPRAVLAKQVASLVGNVCDRIDIVALFANPSREEVETVLETGFVNLLQFHGSETEDFCRSFDVPYLKALRVKNFQFLAESINKYETASYLLLDSYSDRELGGSGETFDWALGKSFVQKAGQKVIIAGGLTPENVKEAVEQIDPFGIDVSSGVEASPGMKDVAKLKRFIEGARSV